MIITLEIPEYNKEDGLKIDWENDFEIRVKESDKDVLIRSNKAGLISLAIQFLTLAQDTVPVGCHIHYDQNNSLESGSKELIIEKI
ncbi:MAG TPA: hypothetical protein VIM89_18120 [Mucilaginibacter sp.]